MLGVAQPAALQMSAIEVPRTDAQEEETPLIECVLIPREHGKCQAWYAKTIASTIQWTSLCLETQTYSISLLLSSEADKELV